MNYFFQLLPAALLKISIVIIVHREPGDQGQYPITLSIRNNDIVLLDNTGQINFLDAPPRGYRGNLVDFPFSRSVITSDRWNAASRSQKVRGKHFA